jgi:hypothetical protein
MSLPLVVAGPIVRRVEGRFCSFWVALSKPATVTSHVWAGIQQAGATGTVASGAPKVATGSAPTVRFGPNLHVAVVTARAPASFQPGSIFSYDLSFKATDTGAFPDTTLKTEKLLEDEPESPRLAGVDPAAPRHLALGYRSGQLPSFVTPAAAIVDLRLAQASCRNPAADGADGMGFLDREVEQNLENALARPQQLFLTGDQIYADDVPRSMMKPVADLAVELIGDPDATPTVHPGEQLPIGGTPIMAVLRNFPIHRRLAVVREEARFSTTDGHSHMLTFGEFVALHLVAWSTRAWRALATPDDVYITPASVVREKLTNWEDCHKDNLAQPSLAEWRRKETTLQENEDKPAFERDTGRVQVYQASVGKAARLLANCATYMIFDDHEITDDWNQSKQWRNRVVSSPLGRAILRNGMMAYAVCQAWGNDPRAFTRADESIFDPLDGLPAVPAGSTIWARTKATAPGQPEKLTNNGSLLRLTHGALAGPAPAPTGRLSEDDRKALDKLLGLVDPDTSGGADEKAVFHYTVDGPKHRVVVLDTRTRRSFRGEGQLPPNLLGDSLDLQLSKGLLAGDRELLVAVVPVPIIGPTLIHDIVQPLFAFIHDLNTTLRGRAEADPCHPGRPLTGAERRDIEGWNGDEPAFEKFLERLSTYPSVLVLSGDVHFASSVVLDYWTTGAAPISRIVQLTSSGVRNEGPAILRPLVRALPFGQGLLRGEPSARLAWKEEAAISLPSGSRIPPGRRARMLRKPALVPARGWPAGATITAAPDWRWRANVLRDERKRDELPVTYPFQEPVEEFDPTDVPESFARITARHAAAAMNRKDQVRVVVFMPNAATVSFRLVDTELRVRQTLFSEASIGSALGAPNTVHETRLLPPTDAAAPELETDS